MQSSTVNKLLKLTPAAKSAASVGQPTLRFGCPLARRYEARKLPLLSEMLEKVQEKAPQQAVYMQQKFKEYFW